MYMHIAFATIKVSCHSPEQIAAAPSQVALDWQVRVSFPPIITVLQVYVATEPTILLGKLTCPLMGSSRTGQRIAEKRKHTVNYIRVHINTRAISTGFNSSVSFSYTIHCYLRTSAQPLHSSVLAPVT